VLVEVTGTVLVCNTVVVTVELWEVVPYTVWVNALVWVEVTVILPEVIVAVRVFETVGVVVE